MTDIKEQDTPRRNLKINDRMKLARLKLNLSQTKLAEIMGVSKSFLSDIENDRRNVSAKTIEKISKLGVSKIYLTYGTGDILEKSELYASQSVPQNVPLKSTLNKNEKSFDEIFKFSKYDEARLTIHNKIIDSINKEHPEFERLQKNMIQLTVFEEAIKYIDNDLIGPVLQTKHSLESLTQYGINDSKLKITSGFTELLPYKFALENISVAIKKFYDEMNEAGCEIDFTFFKID